MNTNIDANRRATQARRRRALVITRAIRLSSIALAAGAGCADSSPGLGEAALGEWLGAYEAAWESKDPGAAAALFSPDAVYRETPFAEPFQGRDQIRAYWAEVTSAQSEIDFDFDVIAVTGSTGVAAWSARFGLADGTPVELDGVFVLEFDAAGLVGSLREWWHAR
jgi:ketosteroid isomerase-like protein